MMLNPVQRSLSQFRRRLLHRRQELYLIEFLSRKLLGKLPRRQVHWLHAAAPTFLAKQPRFPRRMEGRPRTKLRTTRGASIELRKPSAQTHRPKREITQGQLPRPRAFNFAHRQQKQPEHGLRRLMLRQNLLRNFADHRQSSTQLIIALRLMKRFEQLALLDAHQVARLFFDIPELNVRQNLQRRTIPVLNPPRTRSNTAHPSRD